MTPSDRAGSGSPLVTLYAGVAFDGFGGGTEHRLVPELARHRPVLWVDPPVSLTQVVRRRRPVAPLRQLGDQFWVASAVAPPLFTRAGVERATALWQQRTVRRSEAQLGFVPGVAIVANPLTRLDDLRTAATIFYVTDDWVAGAELMGMSVDRVESTWRANLAAADHVLAVSPSLLDDLLSIRPDAHLLPNGCTPTTPGQSRPADVALQAPFAVVAGQFNDRLDLTVLHALSAAGVRLLLVGPRVHRSARTSAPGRVTAGSDPPRVSFDDLIARPGVQWVGPRAPDVVPAYLAAAAVGITPYVDSAFNRASFPLKTLDYLAAGRPAVCTDLPAARWLDADVVACASSPAEFVAQTQRFLTVAPAADACRALAATHSWRARAEQLVDVIDGLTARQTKGSEAQ